jgi:hypothetical protein
MNDADYVSAFLPDHLLSAARACNKTFRNTMFDRIPSVHR